ncbi:MAG: hypothetical protein QOH88_3432 [Verrucomicrobiota bacterium]|jgi:hypothetical protein
MEGGGGGSGGGGDRNIGGGPRTFTGCYTINFETVLLSPRLEAIAALKIGDVLVLKLDSQQDTPIVVATRKNGEEVGTIGSPHLLQLIGCMQEGHKYTAAVVSIEGGACRVIVDHAGK